MTRDTAKLEWQMIDVIIIRGQPEIKKIKCNLLLFMYHSSGESKDNIQRMGAIERENESANRKS